MSILSKELCKLPYLLLLHYKGVRVSLSEGGKAWVWVCPKRPGYGFEFAYRVVQAWVSQSRYVSRRVQLEQ